MNHSQRRRREQLRAKLRKLILLRETGPASAAWHAQRVRLIWHLHDELRDAAEPTPEAEAGKPPER